MKKLWIEFKQRPWWRKTLNIVELLFAGAGFGIIGAWAIFQLGLTNNAGAIDENYRSLMSVSEIEDLKHAELTQEEHASSSMLHSTATTRWQWTV